MRNPDEIARSMSTYVAVISSPLTLTYCMTNLVFVCIAL